MLGGIGSICEDDFGREAFAGNVFAESGESEGLGIFVFFELLVGKHFHVLEDRVKLRLKGLDFLIGEIESREFCDVANVDIVILHWREV